MCLGWIPPIILNDYRPVALTSVVMKSFEGLVLAYLKASTGPLLDPLQFAYRAIRSVDDAANTWLYFVLQHLDRPGTYVRILFVDFSSAINTIIPDTPQNKLTQLSFPTSICQWITSFLTDRQQVVRLGKFSSSTVRSALELLRAVLSPHCSSACTHTTAQLKTPLSSSWSLQTTPHWSASFRTVTSLLTDRRLRSWLSGAVLTTWSLTALWLQWSHSDSWTPKFLRTWSETITLSPWWKRPSRGCTSSTCHRSCWYSSALPSLNPSSACQ